MIRIFPTEYTVTGLNEEDVNRAAWVITISYRSQGQWAVTNFGYCLNSAGEWDHEPSPSNRTDEWKAQHRFPLLEAQRLAVEAYPNLIISGYWVRDGKVVKAE
jgi:hypothetical protein